MKKSVFIAALVLSIPIAAAEPQKEGLKNDSFTTPCQEAQKGLLEVQKKAKKLLALGLKKGSQKFQDWMRWLEGASEESEVELRKTEYEKLLKSDEEYAKKPHEDLNQEDKQK